MYRLSGLDAQDANAQGWGVNWIGTDTREKLLHCAGGYRRLGVEVGGLWLPINQGASFTVDTSSCGLSHVSGSSWADLFSSLGARPSGQVLALGTASAREITKEKFVVHLHDDRLPNPFVTPELANDPRGGM